MFEIKTFETKDLIGNKEFLALCKEYAKCNAIPNTDAVQNFQIEGYLAWGDCVTFGVLFKNHKMIGLAVVVKEYHAHTNEILALLDSFFILPEYRGHNHAKALLNWAKAWAKSITAPVLLLTAPAGSRLEKVYTRKFHRLESTFLIEV